jgi:hypothetical protein
MNKPIEWDKTRDTILEQLWASDIPTLEMPDEFWRRTGLRKTIKALKHRAFKMEIHRPLHVTRKARVDASQRSKRAIKAMTIWQHPDSLDRAELLWTTTACKPAEIANELNHLYGMGITGDRLAEHANKRGWLRSESAKAILLRGNKAPISAILAQQRERAALARLDRQPVSDKVARVEPGTYPQSGFSMLGRRL